MCDKTASRNQGEGAKNQILEYSNSFQFDEVLSDKFFLKHIGFGGKCSLYYKAA
jgi:hypothetical protein